MTRSDPGDNLDLTRDTPIWAWVTTKPGTQQLIIQGGEGIGKNATNQSAIYRYARELLTHHLEPYLLPNETLEVTIILPAGRALAQRTSNEAFGIVEGLSLLGTSGISQPLSAAEHLQTLQTQLQEQTKHHPLLVFCIGENGLNFAQQLGFPPEILIKTANWLGPLLVTAALGEVQQILLLGYHGKLVKLAGGIFHTHHHLADARLEIFIAQGVKVGIPTEFLQKLLHCETIEAAWQLLQS
ncbi:MAG: cobalt-precorrin-5B (C(1))-methyltransferase CbiD, partial [Microcystaceae cyanobacterium]